MGWEKARREGGGKSKSNLIDAPKFMKCDYYRPLEITVDYWRLLEITRDYYRLLETTRDYKTANHVHPSQPYSIPDLLLKYCRKVPVDSCQSILWTSSREI